MSASGQRVRRSKIDPGGIQPYQKDYEKEIYRDLRSLKGFVRQTIDRNDALNLSQNVDAPDDFGEPVEEAERRFLHWFDSALDELVDEEDYDGYVERAYRRGLVHADRELEAAGEDPSGLDPETVGGAISMVSIVASRPRHRRNRASFRDQNHRAVRKIKEDVRGEVARELDGAIRAGENKRQVADTVNDRIDSTGITNGRRHALTITAAVHADATLERFKEVGVDSVEVVAEFQSAGDDKVCDLCAWRHGDRYSLKEARGMLPIHPQCRCVFVVVPLN